MKKLVLIFVILFISLPVFAKVPDPFHFFFSNFTRKIDTPVTRSMGLAFDVAVVYYAYKKAVKTNKTVIIYNASNNVLGSVDKEGNIYSSADRYLISINNQGQKIGSINSNGSVYDYSGNYKFANIHSDGTIYGYSNYYKLGSIHSDGTIYDYSNYYKLGSIHSDGTIYDYSNYYKLGSIVN